MNHYHPSQRERHMIVISLYGMMDALQRELNEVAGWDETADAVIRQYLSDRIDHYRMLIRMYQDDQ